MNCLTFENLQANRALMDLLLLRGELVNRLGIWLGFVVCERFKFYDFSDNIFSFRRLF